MSIVIATGQDKRQSLCFLPYSEDFPVYDSRFDCLEQRRVLGRIHPSIHPHLIIPVPKSMLNRTTKRKRRERESLSRKQKGLSQNRKRTPPSPFPYHHNTYSPIPKTSPPPSPNQPKALKARISPSATLQRPSIIRDKRAHRGKHPCSKDLRPPFPISPI